MLKTLSVIAITPILLISFQANAVKLSKHISTVTPPKPIERVSPVYPINAAREHREGWARLSYIIEKDGSVSNVLVTETSGSKDFAKCVNSIQMKFKMTKGGAKGVTRRFNTKYKATVKALDAKDYEKVESLLIEMRSIRKLHLSENNYLHLLSANYQAALGNNKQQLHHLNRVSMELLSEEAQLSILDKLFVLYITEHQYFQAYKTYKSLQKLDVAKPRMDHYDGIIDKIDALIESEQNIVVNGDMEEENYWHYPLVRNSFSLVNIEGKLNKLDVRCANKRHIYTVEENNIWEIPKSWKSCNIYVYGDNHSTFNVVEYPFKT
jgi:hypothetical protein